MSNLIPTQKPHTFFGHGRTPKGPGTAQRVINYGKAVVRYRKNQGYILPLEIAEPRSSICHSNVCEMYDAKRDRCLHQKCGCAVKEKVTWSTEKCPNGLWDVIYGPAPAPSA